ncbi:MAG: DUF2064 domain-containing protein [Gammaproteobacteria bacterium]|nr:DUF2064 domain-containing protein [Gammaproteobacteria bacterium]
MIFASDSSVLVVFCKRPQLGIGKQRVAVERGQETALELSRLLLSTAMEDAYAWQDGDSACRSVIAPASPEDVDWARGLLGAADIVPQQGNNLGERINHVDQQLRAAGARKILYIGTDAPGLTVERLHEASAYLDHADTVLAPATDGGVVLMGSRVPWPDLHNLPWETDQLCKTLADACGGYSEVAYAPPGDDIDYWADLLRILPALGDDEREWRRMLADWTGRQLRISVVVPAYRDTTALKTLLPHVGAMLSEHDEIIVVDGDNDGVCRDLCNDMSARYLTADSCRGQQLDTGARAATGDVFWFLHADSEPDADSVEHIRKAVANGAAGGYFRFRFLGPPAWYKSALEGLINWRSRVGVPYGDQGLFVVRHQYEAAGGFAHEPLFEEVGLVNALRNAAPFPQLDVEIGVSPRRWERDGWLRRTLHNRLLAIGHRLGIQPSSLARRYR